MELTYTVSKEKGSNRYYAHRVDRSDNPVMSESGAYGTKKHAFHVAAEAMGISYKEYMKLYRKAVNNGTGKEL